MLLHASSVRRTPPPCLVLIRIGSALPGTPTTTAQRWTHAGTPTTTPIHTSITLGGDLRTGRIGYGAMRLTGTHLWGEYPDRDSGITLLRKAVEAGVTLIDTADVYGPHTNELLIREALHPCPDDLVIATKGGFVRGGPDLTSIDAVGNANYLRQCAQLSARRLGAERIDLYYLHSGWARDASFEEQVGTLAELRRQGVIRHIGLSNVTPEQLRAAREITEIAAVTAHFNVVDRHETALLDATSEAGAVLVPWQPVSSHGPAPPRTPRARKRSAESSAASPPGTARRSPRSHSPGWRTSPHRTSN